MGQKSYQKRETNTVFANTMKEIKLWKSENHEKGNAECLIDNHENIKNA